MLFQTAIEVCDACIGSIPAEFPLLEEVAEGGVDAVCADVFCKVIQDEGRPGIPEMRLVGVQQVVFSVEIGAVSPAICALKVFEEGGYGILAAVLPHQPEGRIDCEPFGDHG